MIKFISIVSGLILTIVGIKLNSYWVIVTGLLIVILSSIKLTEIKETTKSKGNEV